MIKAKSCPFCGSDRTGLYIASANTHDFALFHYGCFVCGAKTRVYSSQRDALEAWNQRAPSGLHTALTEARDWIDDALMIGLQAANIWADEARAKVDSHPLIIQIDAALAKARRDNHD